MVYGRVIGNELRDVPPECLPIWGQRWSGYRAPHGPSPFSTRIFSVDRMSEVGPVLTSPSQFEMTLTEEDEGEDASTESSRFRSSFLSSPIAIQTDATEQFRPETSMPRSVHHSSNHPHCSPQMLYRNTGHPPVHTSTPFSAASLPRRQSIPNQGGHGPLKNDYTLWDVDCTSTGIQLQTSHPHPSPVQSGQLQHAALLHSNPEWQFGHVHTQPSTYPSQLNSSSQPSNGSPFPPFQGDDRTNFFQTTSLSSPNCFAIPCTQQIVADDPPWNHESNVTMIPSITDSRYPMTPPWPQGPTLPDLSFPGLSQNSGSPTSPGPFYHLVSDHHGKSTHPDDFLGTFAHAQAVRLTNPEPGAEQFIG